VDDAWLYIVLLGLVLVVYAKFVPRREADTKQTNVMKEIEDTMERFSADLEEENRQFLELVSDMKKEHALHTAKLQGRIEALEQQNRTVSEQLTLLQRAGQQRGEERSPESQGPPSAPAPPISQLTGSQAARPRYEPDRQPSGFTAPQPERERVYIRERYANVFELYNQGKSTEYIAKKLEMNKGEVMLIIQLAKQEDQARV